MISFAKIKFEWLNVTMRNFISNNLKAKLRKISDEDKSKQIKVTDVNILLNRVRLNKKTETRKKLYFSAAASTGLILFGLIIF